MEERAGKVGFASGELILQTLAACFHAASQNDVASSGGSDSTQTTHRRQQSVKPHGSLTKGCPKGQYLTENLPIENFYKVGFGEVDG